MFATDDEDGDFLSPTGGAKLASLFGLDQAASQGNESFQYTAPKQPRKTSNPGQPVHKPAAPPGSPAVLLATAVHAFKYINGQYAKQGKLGAAVLGNHTLKDYKLLLYASQQKQVTAAKIHVGFVFTVQPSNYCTFYDDQRQNWSLMFDTEKSAIDFCKEVCLAKVNSAPSLDVAVVQDLSLGDGQAVENGDSLEVAYTGWLLQNHAVGQVFDSNINKDKLLRLKLGSGKVIKGWEDGMQGMKKAGRRLMVIPPSLGYGSQGVANRVPADSTLIFEAELRRVKFVKDNGSDRASAGSRDSAAPSPAPSPAASVENLGPEPPAQPQANTVPNKPGEPPLRAKSNSLSEQLTNPDATKAKLISRMARMGQPMLPFLAGTASQPDSSDSEMEDPSVSRVKERSPARSPVQISTGPASQAQVLAHPHAAPPTALLPVAMTTAAPQPVMPGTTHAFQPYYGQTSMAPSQLQPVGQMYPAQTVPYMGTGDVTSFLMTEARQHNTEIRLAVGKVGDKVDQLASKMEDIQRQGSMPIMAMETSMIMHSIQRIIQENESLKKEVFEKSSRIEEQNRKIGDLINQNQRYMEQSHLLLEQRNDSMKSSSEQNQTRVLQAEQDKHALPQDMGLGQVRLSEELAGSTARVAQLQQEAISHQQRAADLQSQLNVALQDSQTHCTRIAVLEAQLEELNESTERGQAQYRLEKQKRKEMELKVSNVEEEVQDLKTDKESLERTLADRKRKWQSERQRWDEEMEELRRSSQQDQDNLRAELRKARSSTDHAASSGQLAQLHAELEEEWKRKCEQSLASAKEQQGRELAELTEHRDSLEQKLAQLQEKFTALKQSRDSEEHRLLQQQAQSDELQALHEKYTALEGQSAAVREKLEGRVVELEGNLAEQGQGDTAGEVKRVMNGVFHSLREEFDLNESYTGSTVLGLIVSTIKEVTLQLLSGAEKPSVKQIEKEDEDEEEEEEKEKEEKEEEEEEEDKEEEEKSEVRHSEEKSPQVVHVNVKKEEVEEKEQAKSETEKRREDCGVTESRDMQETTPEQDKLKKEEELTANSTQSQPVEVTHSPTATKSSTVQEACPPTTTLTPQEENPSGPPDSTTGPDVKVTPKIEDKTQSRGDITSLDVKEVSVIMKGPLKELTLTTPKATGPPTQPPPPPNPLHDSPGKATSLTEGVVGENGEEPFFPSTAPTKPPPPPSEEDDDELSLKGRPPPAPLFGEEDEDDDDLDWLG